MVQLKPDLFLIKPVPEKGLGLVASRDIKPGQLVLSETALITARREQSDDITVNQARQIFRQVAILTVDQRKQMMSLCCVSKKSVLNVFRNNCIYVDKIYSGLFLTLSRINHSCCPNSMVCQGLEKEVRATKYITRGEEITISYIINNWDIKRNRVQELSYWNFKCTCEICSLRGKEQLDNDMLRQDIIQNDDRVNEFLDKVFAVQDKVMPENDRRLLMCDIYLSIEQMILVSEEKLSLVYKMGHQMIAKWFSSHIQCLYLNFRARALGLGTQEVDQNITYHGNRISVLASFSLDWRNQFCEAVARGMLF